MRPNGVLSLPWRFPAPLCSIERLGWTAMNAWRSVLLRNIKYLALSPRGLFNRKAYFLYPTNLIFEWLPKISKRGSPKVGLFYPFYQFDFPRMVPIFSERFKPMGLPDVNLWPQMEDLRLICCQRHWISLLLDRIWDPGLFHVIFYWVVCLRLRAGDPSDV